MIVLAAKSFGLNIRGSNSSLEALSAEARHSRSETVAGVMYTDARRGPDRKHAGRELYKLRLRQNLI
jgi:hypothetical protein